MISWKVVKVIAMTSENLQVMRLKLWIILLICIGKRRPFGGLATSVMSKWRNMIKTKKKSFQLFQQVHSD